MIHIQQNITPMLGALRSVYSAVLPTGAWGGRAKDTPFVTISRQAGAGGRSLAVALVEKLNQIDPGELPWTVWDNELVERVAGEHKLPASCVERLEEPQPSWLEEALGGLALGDGGVHAPAEATVFRRVSMTIRALAQLGRVVIVGRGSAFVTADMTDGVHVRLVAPTEFRVRATADAQKTSAKEAAAWVADRDRAREAFYRRHWPKRAVTAEQFTMTLNTAAMTLPQQVGAVLAALDAPVGERTAGPEESRKRGVS